MMKRYRAVYALLITLSAASVTFAQSATARLYGTVFDPQKLVLPGVSIQVREVRTGISRNTISGADGYYEVQGLLPGDFEVTWELPGFSTGKTQVHMEVNQQLKLDLNMKVGDIASSVVVNASPPLLNSHDATLGTVIDQQKMESLPLNGRHFLELSLLTPGVHTSHGAQMGDRNPLYWRPGQNSAISVSGGRSNSNIYLLDGTINTDPTFNTYVISLSPDAVREFQTQSGTYSAARADIRQRAGQQL